MYRTKFTPKIYKVRDQEKDNGVCQAIRTLGHGVVIIRSIPICRHVVIDLDTSSKFCLPSKGKYGR